MNTSRQGKELLEVATDLTSWYGFLAYLTGDLSTSWARNNYLDVTVMTLIGADIRIPIPPADKRGPAYELRPLRARFEFATEVGSAKDDGLEYQAAWLHNPAKAKTLRDFLNDLTRDKSYDDWLSWHIRREWPQHILRCHGLVEKGYEDLVSILVPELTVEEIKDVNKRALKDPEGFSAAATDTDRRLFTADVMRRGVYYKRIAELLNRQQLLHQTRRIPISAADGVDQHLLVLGFEPFLLAQLIQMHTNVAVRRVKKVAEWIESVDAGSAALLQKWKLPNPTEFEANEKELNFAADEIGQLSKDLEFSIGRHEVNKAVELVGVGIGSGVCTGVGLIVDKLLGGGGAVTLLGSMLGGVLGHEAGEAIKARLAKIRGDPLHAARELASAGPALVRSSLVLREPSEFEAPRSTQQDPEGSGPGDP